MKAEYIPIVCVKRKAVPGTVIVKPVENTMQNPDGKDRYTVKEKPVLRGYRKFVGKTAFFKIRT